MATLTVKRELRGTDGYAVESAEGELGQVEEVWLGDADEPRALAVRTTEGRRALLAGDDVLAVDREHGWVVVPPRVSLLELAPPRLTHDGDRPVASWATTGAEIPAPVRPRGLLARARRAEAETGAGTAERPLWQLVAVLYVFLAVMVGLVTAVAFAVAELVGGAAY